MGHLFTDAPPPNSLPCTQEETILLNDVRHTRCPPHSSTQDHDTMQVLDADRPETKSKL